jgi:hypothetical protein
MSQVMFEPPTLTSCRLSTVINLAEGGGQIGYLDSQIFDFQHFLTTDERPHSHPVENNVMYGNPQVAKPIAPNLRFYLLSGCHMSIQGA